MKFPRLVRTVVGRWKRLVLVVAGAYLLNVMVAGAGGLLGHHGFRWRLEEIGTPPEFPAWTVVQRQSFGLEEWEFTNGLAKGAKTNPSRLLPPFSAEDNSWCAEKIREAPLLSPGFRIVRGGWPFACLRCEVEYSAPEFGTVTGGIVLSRGAGVNPAPVAGVLPLLPIAPALLANSVFYFLAILASLRVCARVVRMTRRRLGHCATCGYALKGLDAAYAGDYGEHVVRCPECGTDSLVAM